MPLKGTDYTGFIDLWLTLLPPPTLEHAVRQSYVWLLMRVYVHAREDVWVSMPEGIYVGLAF